MVRTPAETPMRIAMTSRLAFTTIMFIALTATAYAQEPPLRRYALVIGSNNGGGAGRDKLRYAGHDADTVADVLQQLGGVSQSDLSLLSEPNGGALDQKFDELSKRVRDERKRGQRVELVVYYSGHS